MRESRGLLDLLQSTENNREYQCERALHDLCTLIHNLGGMLLLPVQIRVVLCGGEGDGAHDNNPGVAIAQVSKTAGAEEV